MKPVVEIIGEVVAEMQKKWDSGASTPEKPYYMHGHINEITNILIERDKSSIRKFQKYPCIILIQDFEEKVGKDKSNAELRIVIATATNPTITASDRYAQTFKPILYPLFELFLSELKRNKYINQLNYEFTKYDRLYWGENDTANIANDFIDAIELTNLNLTILKTC